MPASLKRVSVVKSVLDYRGVDKGAVEERDPGAAEGESRPAAARGGKGGCDGCGGGRGWCRLKPPPLLLAEAAVRVASALLLLLVFALHTSLLRPATSHELWPAPDTLHELAVNVLHTTDYRTKNEMRSMLRVAEGGEHGQHEARRVKSALAQERRRTKSAESGEQARTRLLHIS